MKKRKDLKRMRKIALLFMIMMLLMTGCGKGAADGQTQASTETQAETQESTEALTETQADTQELTETQISTETQEAVPSAAIDTIQTDSFSVDYCKFGSGERALIILPGLSIQSVMGSADAIAQAYQPLAEDYTIYVLDRRKELPPVYTVNDSTEDVVAALQALGLNKVSLFGASYGGMEAMIMAAAYPEMVDKIVVASTSANLTDEEFQTVENWINLAKAGDAEGLYLAFGEALYPKEVFEQSRQLLIDAAKTVTEEELSRFIILGEGMEGYDITDQMAKIQCPVLAIGDRQDQVLGGTATEKIGDYMSENADFQLYMYDGYGHAVYDLAPDIKERMKDFLMQ